MEIRKKEGDYVTDKIAYFSSPGCGRTWKIKQQILKKMLEADEVACHEERKLIGGGREPQKYCDFTPIDGYIPTYYITMDNGIAYFLNKEQMMEVWEKYEELKG